MTRRRAVPAAFAVVLLVVGQLLALAHEAGTRHVTCIEHGEQVEAAALAWMDHTCDHAHLVAVDGDIAAHVDCAIVRSLHQASSPSLAASHVVAIASATVVATRPVLALSTSDQARYRIAPKTSPPGDLRTS